MSYNRPPYYIFILRSLIPQKSTSSYYCIGVIWVFHYNLTFFQGLISLLVISLADWADLVSTCELRQDGAGYQCAVW